MKCYERAERRVLLLAREFETERSSPAALQNRVTAAQLIWDRHFVCPNCHISLLADGRCQTCGHQQVVLQRPQDLQLLRELVPVEQDDAFREVKAAILAVVKPLEALVKPPKAVKSRAAGKASGVGKEKKRKRKAPMSYWDRVCQEKSGQCLTIQPAK